MERHLPAPAWAEAWAARTYAPQQYFCHAVFLSAAVFSLVSSTRFYLYIRSFRKATPEVQQQLNANYEERSIRTSRRQLLVALMYYLAGVTLWTADAAIGISLIAKDAKQHPDIYTWSMWAEIALYCVQLLAYFMSVYIFFPLLQVLLFSWTYAKVTRKTNTDGTLGVYVPEVRTLTTHFAQLCAMAMFLIIAFWPISLQPFTRMMLLQAACGSGVMWASTSFRLCYSSTETDATEAGIRITAQDVMILCGQSWCPLYFRDGRLTGPARREDEKEALLGDEHPKSWVDGTVAVPIGEKTAVLVDTQV